MCGKIKEKQGVEIFGRSREPTTCEMREQVVGSSYDQISNEHPLGALLKQK